MPTFKILLAADRPYYGTMTVEAPTWEEAVQSLDLDDWYDSCDDEGDSLEGLRIVHVEDEDRNDEIVAEDIAYNDPLVHSRTVADRLRRMLAEHATHDGLLNLISLYIEELEATGRDPVFVEQDQKEAV